MRWAASFEAFPRIMPAYLATSVTGISWPQYERVSNWVLPVMFGERAVMLWLIIMGAKERPLAPPRLILRG